MGQCVIDRGYEGCERERAREGPPDGFPALPPIPGGRRADTEFQKLEYRFPRRNFSRRACHPNQISEPEDKD